MRSLYGLAAVVIILAAVKLAAPVIVPLLMAVTLVVAFQPIGGWFARRGFRPAVTALVTTAIVLLILIGAAWVLAQAAATFVDSLPKYQTSLLALRDDAVGWFGDHNMHAAARTVGRWDPTPFFVSTARDGLFGAGAALETLFMVVVITVFIQLEASNYRRKIARALGGTRQIRATNATLADVQRYLAGKVVLSLATGAMSGLWCWAMGIPNPLLWGVIAFLLNFVPYVGSLIAAVPPVLLGLVHGGGGVAAAVTLGYVGINLAENVVEPRVMGKLCDVSPLAVLLSMLVWGFVLGPVGALLAQPLTMVVRDVLAQTDDGKWIAALLSAGPPDVAPARTVRE